LTAKEWQPGIIIQVALELFRWIVLACFARTDRKDEMGQIYNLTGWKFAFKITCAVKIDPASTSNFYDI
jgi:hypothetical protein